MREVECVRESPKPGADDTLIDDELCPGPKPGTRELCTSKTRCCVTKKREDYELPVDMMRELWYQTVVDYINADESVSFNVWKILLSMETSSCSLLNMDRRLFM